MKEWSAGDLEQSLAALLDPQIPLLSNLSNAAACLYNELGRVNWAGFYLANGETLYLGPFGGRPACTAIPFGRGVCGAAARTGQVQLVPDVHAFPGHIACDSASRSEIVLPLVKDGLVKGVLDIDSPLENRFFQEDAQRLTRCAQLLLALPGWDRPLV